MPKLVAEIRAAISSNEPARLELAAHTLKGSADIFAAKNAVQACWNLECMGKNGQIDKAAAAWDDFEAKIQQCKWPWANCPKPPLQHKNARIRFQYFTHFLGQRHRGEGLLEEGPFGLQNAVTHTASSVYPET